MKIEIENVKKEFTKKIQEKEFEIQNIKIDFAKKVQEKDNTTQQLSEKFDGQLQERDDKIQKLSEKFNGPPNNKNDQTQQLRKDFEGQLKEKNDKIQKLSEKFDGQLQEKDKKIQKLSEKFDGKLKEKDEKIQKLEKKDEEMGKQFRDKDKEFKKLKMVVVVASIAIMVAIFVTKNDVEEKHKDIYYQIKSAGAKLGNTEIYSPDFFTAKRYKGRLEVYLNGHKDGEGTHISVFFHNIQGPYDDLLEWPIPWKSQTFTLLINDKEVGKSKVKSTAEGGKLKEHFTRPTFFGGKNLGSYTMFEKALLENVTDNDVVTIKYDMYGF